MRKIACALIYFVFFIDIAFADKGPCGPLFEAADLNIKQAEKELQNREHEYSVAKENHQEILKRIEVISNKSGESDLAQVSSESLQVQLKNSEQLMLNAKAQVELAKNNLNPLVKKQEKNQNLNARTRDIDLTTYGSGAESDTRLLGFQQGHGGGKTSGDIVAAVRNSDDTISYFLGDVTGHSNYASEVSTKVAKEIESPAFKAILTVQNDDMIAAHRYLSTKHKELFAADPVQSSYTLGHFRFNSKTGKVDIGSSGEIFNFIIRSDGKVEMVPLKGTKIGFAIDKWTTTEIQLRSSETVVATTDGLLEALSLYPKLAKKFGHNFDNLPDVDYGEKVMKELLEVIMKKYPDATPAKINEEIRKFITKNKLQQTDDETLLTFKRK